MHDHDQEMAQTIIETFQAVLRALQTATAPVWVELDLSMAQLKTLFVLSSTGPAPIGQVAESLGISLPTASHLVERLVQAGLAERTEDQLDRRRTLARLSPQGVGLSERLRQGSRDRLHDWLARLGGEDRAALLRGLRALQRAAEL
jgi:DNA-binding MarR family transcriptional regulator